MKVTIGPYRKNRKIQVRIDKYDTWNMDETLSIIILPMLKQLQETKHGSPIVSKEDCPEELQTPSEGKTEDDMIHVRWDWVMNEMIWTFEQKQPDYDWTEQYYHSFESFESYDRDGMTRHQDRISNGLRLFGKYFESLWD